MTIILYTERTI